MAPLIGGLPAGRVRAAIGGFVTRLADRLGHPVACWLAMSLAMWGWHTPAAFELALRSRAWHVAEHACFLTAGLLFWWPVVRPWPFTARWPEWAMIPYLLLADVQNTALAAILTFSDRVLYPTYGRGPGALDDQVVAGLLMWVPMSLAYLVPAAMLTVRWLSPSTRSAGMKRAAGVRVAPAGHTSAGAWGARNGQHGIGELQGVAGIPVETRGRADTRRGRW
jgi:cytochrome c oxidase assembly factor CtaG